MAVLVGAASVVLAGCGTSGRQGTPAPTVTTVAAAGAKGPNGLPPATVPAGGCRQLTGPVATLAVNESGLDPRCATVTTKQQLKIVNDGKSFHNVQIIDLNANLAPGDTQFFEEVGKYFDPGNYLIFCWTEADTTEFPNFNGTLVVKQG